MTTAKDAITHNLLTNYIFYCLRQVPVVVPTIAGGMAASGLKQVTVYKELKRFENRLRLFDLTFDPQTKEPIFTRKDLGSYEDRYGRTVADGTLDERPIIDLLPPIVDREVFNVEADLGKAVKQTRLRSQIERG